jgi:hypothetical protein
MGYEVSEKHGSRIKNNGFHVQSVLHKICIFWLCKLGRGGSTTTKKHNFFGKTNELKFRLKSSWNKISNKPNQWKN